MRHLSTDFIRRQNQSSTTNNSNPTQQQPRRYRHPNLPPLFYAVTSRNWARVTRRAQSHPHEICSMEYTSGDTPLHYACRFHAPVNAIRALQVMKYSKNNEGATPLHIAASHRCSAAVIRCLVEDENQREHANTAIAKFDANASGKSEAELVLLPLSLTKMGRIPLHYACLSFRGLEVEAFKILLKATIEACVVLEQRRPTTVCCVPKSESSSSQPSIVVSSPHSYCDATKNAKTSNNTSNSLMEEQDLEWWEDVTDVAHQQANAFTMQDYSHQTPLSLLFRRYRERVRSVIHMLERNRDSITVISEAGDGETSHTNVDTTHIPSAVVAVRDELGELWEKARLMVCLMAEKRLERERRMQELREQEEEQQKQERMRMMESSSLFVASTYPMNRENTKGKMDGKCTADDFLISLEEEERRKEAANAVAREAAKWAKQQYQNNHYRHDSSDQDIHDDDDDDLLQTIEDDNSIALKTEQPSTETNTETAAKPPHLPHHSQQRRNRRKFRLVHASVGLAGYGCPPEMIRLALSVYPNQIREMDEDGNLPLHIASVASSFLPSTTNNNSGNDSTSDEDSLISIFSSNLSMLSSSTTTVGGGGHSTMSTGSTIASSLALEPNPFHTVIRMLLRVYPTAAQIPHGQSGRLPLILAIEGKKRTYEDGIGALLECYPQALESTNIPIKLYPKILSLVGGDGSVLKQTAKKKKKVKKTKASTSTSHSPNPMNTLSRKKKNALARLRRKNRNKNLIPTALFELIKAKPGLIVSESTFSSSE